MNSVGWGVERGDLRVLWRMLYTLVFFIVVSTILMNIIFGVIIDTFAGEKSQLGGRNFISGFFFNTIILSFLSCLSAPPPWNCPQSITKFRWHFFDPPELREKKDSITQEIQNRCFICGLDRLRFDQGSGSHPHNVKKNAATRLYFL
jgi:hypothetical protein